MISPIKTLNKEVYLLDQRQLPQQEIWLKIDDADSMARAIKDMVVRGAPAIGISAAFGIALEAERNRSMDIIDLKEHLLDAITTLRSTRPTAYNLFKVLADIEGLIKSSKESISLLKDLWNYAENLKDFDIKRCIKMSENGLEIIKGYRNFLIHCNAGALATGGYGTALGLIRRRFEYDPDIFVFVDETRPYLQGSRLSAWELSKENIPYAIITDSAAAFFMSQKRIDCVIVGADRITKDGDVANKIGTYGLAILADYHKIPFIVAAPVETIDPSIRSGNDITIEHRDKSEITHFKGIPVSPDDAEAINPAFDITPSRFVTYIVTEKGVFSYPYDFFKE